MSAEGLGKWHDVDRAELDSGSAAVLGHFLKTDHVIGPVNPHQVYEVALEPDRRLEFARRIQEASVTGDGHHFVAGTDTE